MNDIVRLACPSGVPARRAAEAAAEAELEESIRTVLRWIGEDPERDGLKDTPARVARALREHFAGYRQDPARFLATTFEETNGYDGIVLLRGIPFESHCEHHMAPIIGRAWVAYVPENRVVGISKLARVVDAFARRLQIQERMTAEIADAIEAALQPRGVAVAIEAVHHCMSTRGVHKRGSDMVTSRLTGCFRDDPALRSEFFAAVHAGRAAP